MCVCACVCMCGGGLGAYGSRLLFGSGHKTSSTSQAMSSRASHQGKYHLVCRIHPWIDPTSMSPHASSIACRRVIRACGCRSNTFHHQAEKNSSIAFRRGLLGGRYKRVKGLWLMKQSRTRAANIIPDDNKPGLLWSVLHNCM